MKVIYVKSNTLQFRIKQYFSIKPFFTLLYNSTLTWFYKLSDSEVYHCNCYAVIADKI